MTITLDLSDNLLTIILALIGFVVTIGTTWFFTRRHYIKESRPPTEVDLAMQDNKLGFWLFLILVGGMILVIPLTIIVLALAGSLP